jgi:hypothetical protein
VLNINYFTQAAGTRCSHRYGFYKRAVKLDSGILGISLRGIKCERWKGSAGCCLYKYSAMPILKRDILTGRPLSLHLDTVPPPAAPLGPNHALIDCSRKNNGCWSFVPPDAGAADRQVGRRGRAHGRHVRHARAYWACSRHARRACICLQCSQEVQLTPVGKAPPPQARGGSNCGPVKRSRCPLHICGCGRREGDIAEMSSLRPVYGDRAVNIRQSGAGGRRVLASAGRILSRIFSNIHCCSVYWHQLHCHCTVNALHCTALH